MSYCKKKGIQQTVAECLACEDSLKLPENLMIVQIDAPASGELLPVENPDAAMYDFVKDQINILTENDQ